jgi:DNA polymerase eta
MPFPFTRDVTVDLIAGFGDKLWKELVGTESKFMKVTIVQLSFTGLETAETGQKTIEGFLKPTSKRARNEDENVDTPLPQDNQLGENPEPNDATSFICRRCGKRISLPDTYSGESADNAKALVTMRVEHDDFHFAQELARTAGNDDQARQVKQPHKKKRQLEPEGIAKFFIRK